MPLIRYAQNRKTGILLEGNAETGIVSLYISREKEINSEREQGKGYCV